MKHETNIDINVGKRASEIIKFLQSDENLTFGEVLDALSMALIFSAFNASISKEEFMDNTNKFWDSMQEEVNQINNKDKSLH